MIDRIVKPSEIKCPKCNIPAGMPCYSNGKFHDERIFQATVATKGELS